MILFLEKSSKNKKIFSRSVIYSKPLEIHGNLFVTAYILYKNGKITDSIVSSLLRFIKKKKADKVALGGVKEVAAALKEKLNTVTFYDGNTLGLKYFIHNAKTRLNGKEHISAVIFCEGAFDNRYFEPTIFSLLEFMSEIIIFSSQVKHLMPFRDTIYSKYAVPIFIKSSFDERFATCDVLVNLDKKYINKPIKASFCYSITDPNTKDSEALKYALSEYTIPKKSLVCGDLSYIEALI